MNLDSEFVLRGKSLPYRSRSGERISNDSDECNNEESRKISGSLEIMLRNLNMTHSSLETSLGEIKESDVSHLHNANIHCNLCTDRLTDEERARLMQKHDTDLEYNYDGTPKPSEMAVWYTRPHHRYGALFRRSDSSVGNPAGILGQVIDGNLASKYRIDSEMEYDLVFKGDILAAKYFPVTLGAACCLDASAGENIKQYFSPIRSRSAVRMEDVPYIPRKQDLGIMLLAKVAPTIASSLNFIVTSPFEGKLARLRKHRLQLEKDMLLELELMKGEELAKLREEKEEKNETPENQLSIY